MGYHQVLSLPWGPSWGQMGFLGLWGGQPGWGWASPPPLPWHWSSLVSPESPAGGLWPVPPGKSPAGGGMGGMQKAGRGGAWASPPGPVPQGNRWPWCDSWVPPHIELFPGWPSPTLHTVLTTASSMGLPLCPTAGWGTTTAPWPPPVLPLRLCPRAWGRTRGLRKPQWCPGVSPAGVPTSL